MPNIKLNIDASFFNEAYIPLLNSTERFLCLIGGAGSGKSVFAVQKLIIKALKYSERKILIVRKVQATLRESVFAQFLDQLSKMNILQYCKYTTAHMKIELPNGSVFIFMGLDDPEKIKSIFDISDILMEEASEFNFSDFSQLNLRLRSNAENQQMLIVANPISKSNWIYKHFFEQEQPNTVILRTNYTHNRHLPQEYIDTLLSYKETNPLYYKIYAEGEFASLDERVFNNFEVAPVEDNGDLLIGCDFGFSQDPTCILGVETFGNTIYVVDEIYKKGMFIENIVNEIKKKGWDKYAIFCDSAEPRSIADMKRQGLNARAVKKGKDSVSHSLFWLQNKKIIIDPKCENLIREMNDMTWMKDKDGVYIQKVNTKSSSDHAVDSLRYATEIIRINNKVKFIDKSIFGL